MLARNEYLVRERVYPLVQLSVGVVFTFGCIGLLGYGMLALIGVEPLSSLARTRLNGWIDDCCERNPHAM